MDKGKEAMRRCITQLKEHYTSITITGLKTDPVSGIDERDEMDWGYEPDDDDE